MNIYYYVKLRPKTFCQLFDDFVLGYSKSEGSWKNSLWKRLLKIRSNTCNSSIYGAQVFKNRFWLKLVDTDIILWKHFIIKCLMIVLMDRQIRFWSKKDFT